MTAFFEKLQGKSVNFTKYNSKPYIIAVFLGGPGGSGGSGGIFDNF